MFIGGNRNAEEGGREEGGEEERGDDRDQTIRRNLDDAGRTVESD